MKISVLNSGNVAETEQFAYLKECGFDGAMFALNKYFERNGIYGDISSVTDEMIAKHFSLLKECADEAEFFIDQTHSAFTGYLHHYDNDVEEIVQRQIACIKATHYLGCKYCVVHPIITSGRRYDLKIKEAFDTSVDFYTRLLPALEEYDVYCCIENMWVLDPVHKHICSTILSHAEEMVQMCDALGDRFKICLDIGHAVLTQDNPVEMVRICGDRLVVLHAHEVDGIYDLHTFPFSKFGQPRLVSPMRIDWELLMKTLKEINYEGNLKFEISIPGPCELHAAGVRYLAEIGRYLVSIFEGHDSQ